MSIQARFDIELTVRSFDYVAKQLARNPFGQYEQILRAADKHRSALLLLRADVFEAARQALRTESMARTEFDRVREATEQSVLQAQQAIDRIATQYMPHRLAA